jgi:hypothetical protein
MDMVTKLCVPRRKIDDKNTKMERQTIKILLKIFSQKKVKG